MTRIVCAGTFDRLHTGHLEYFRKSRELAEDPYLIVIVARDSTSERIKGKKTINDENTRLRRVAEIEFVDEAVLGYSDDVIGRVLSLKPDIIALGYDQWAKEDWLASELRKKDVLVKIVRMPEFEKRFLDA